MKTNQEKILELEKFAKEGRLIEEFEKTDVYKLIIDWIKREGDYKKIFKAPREDRGEIIGYVRFGEALLNQFEVWKRMGEKKRKEINDLLSEEDLQNKR